MKAAQEDAVRNASKHKGCLYTREKAKGIDCSVVTGRKETKELLFGASDTAREY